MTAKRAIVDIVERLYSDDMQEDWTEVRLQGFDATDLLIELFGESGEEVPSFAYEPHEFGGIAELLARDPRIDFRAEIDADFDILGFLKEGMTQDASDEEITQAWRSWRESILASGQGDLWAANRWAARAEEVGGWLSEPGVTKDALVPLMRTLSAAPAAMEALVEALRGWQGDPVSGLRTTRAIVDGLQAPGSGS